MLLEQEKEHEHFYKNLKTRFCMLDLLEMLHNLHPYPLLFILFHVNKFSEDEHGRESLEYRPLMDVLNKHKIAHH